MTTYMRLKLTKFRRHRVRSVLFRRTRKGGTAVFSNLFLPETGNHGAFCRAPRNEKS